MGEELANATVEYLNKIEDILVKLDLCTILNLDSIYTAKDMVKDCLKPTLINYAKCLISLIGDAGVKGADKKEETKKAISKLNKLTQ